MNKLKDSNLCEDNIMRTVKEDSQKSKTKIFAQKYDLSKVPNENLGALASKIKNMTDDYDFFGIRYVEPQYALLLKPSHVWNDGVKTSGVLDGVSSYDIGIDYWTKPADAERKLKNAIQNSMGYGLGGRKPFIVFGNDASGGDDPKEIIISDPQILDISEFIKDESLTVKEQIMKIIKEQKLTEKESSRVRALIDTLDDPNGIAKRYGYTLTPDAIKFNNGSSQNITKVQYNRLKELGYEGGNPSNIDNDKKIGGRWNTRLKAGSALRRAIAEEDYQGVIDGIRACYKEMLDKGIIDDWDYERWTEDLDMYETDDEDIEDTLDYELGNLYDACDNLGCWVELDESLKEDLDEDREDTLAEISNAILNDYTYGMTNTGHSWSLDINWDDDNFDESIKEDLDNVESTDNTVVINQPTGAAEEESKKYKKRFEDATKEPENAPLFGAKEQPKPDEVEEPKAELKESKLTLDEGLFEDNKFQTKRNLKEEVSDLAYQMADEIDERFREQGFISWDDFNEAFEDAYPGLIDWTDDSFNDLETDVRGILSNMGWETIFEGDDEGSLKLLDESLSEASTLPTGGKDEKIDTDAWSVIYWELSDESEGSADRKMARRAKVNALDLRVYASDESGFDLAKEIADAWGVKYKIENVNAVHANKFPEEKLQMTLIIPEEMIG